MCLPDNHLAKIRASFSPPVCYRSNVDRSYQTGQRATLAKTPYMIAKQSLKPKLASFLQIYFPGSSPTSQPAETDCANLLEDNWMNAGTRHHPGDYLRTRTPNEPLGNY
jgi:hypothetical protein